jgi:hypothetical protein
MGTLTNMADTTDGNPGNPLSHDEVVGVCGDLLDWKVNAIIATGAGLSELEAAQAWATGADEVLGEERAPLEGVTAQVYDILMAGEEYDDDRDR